MIQKNKKLKKLFHQRNWIFDTISSNKLNGGKLLSRENVLNEVAKYKYGIGVGRAVLEMNALGLKTLICAKNVNGIMINEKDFDYMKENNFTDVDIPCFSNDIRTCICNFDKAIIKTYDVLDVLPLIDNIKF